MPAGLLSTSSAVLDVRAHVAQFGVESHARSISTGAPHRSNERARRLERQRGDVAAEIAPNAILVEVLLDIREIERRHRPALRANPVAYGTNSLGPGEVANDGHQQVLRLEAPEEGIVVFVGEEASLRARFVGCNHQIFVAWLIPRAESAGRRVVELRSEIVERVIDVLHALQVAVRQR